ncbi:hypothetical protein [Salinarimonas soli]|uniref:Uncharacterized protein n=1 Tax=Salinarimonas soli TaxID=1638099 RepID=A0A5B2V8Q2_9HYPH|nr:hypothetical protein [Salinarimonas soli]KAA2235873.1 hypothetical protein F0L46_17695 [Salinarimonas soli]
MPARNNRQSARRRAHVPLDGWRKSPPAALEQGDVVGLERTLAAVSILREPRWGEALAGDAGAAAALAIEALHGGTAHVRRDLAMSLLALRALRGDATAALIVAHGLTRLSRRHARPRLAELAGEWIAWRRDGSGGSSTMEGA